MEQKNYGWKKIELHSIDIYGSNNVDIICDAHYLPFKNNFYDGVLIKALGALLNLPKLLKKFIEFLKIMVLCM